MDINWRLIDAVLLSLVSGFGMSYFKFGKRRVGKTDEVATAQNNLRAPFSYISTSDMLISLILQALLQHYVLLVGCNNSYSVRSLSPKTN